MVAGCGGGSESTDAVALEGNAAEIRKAFVGIGGIEVNPPALAAVSGANAAAADAVASPSAAAVGNDAPLIANAASTASAAASGTVDATGGPPAIDTAGERFADEALAAINAARSQGRTCGDRAFPAAGPLRWNARAAYAALLEVEWMQKANTFGHEWPTGEHVWHRLEMSGYKWWQADENIAAGFRTLDATMRGWIESPPHCVALMRADITEVGVAVVPGAPGNTYSSYWAMVMATPRPAGS